MPQLDQAFAWAMFEIIIICVILLAISYWAVLWVMGRREDVLHGEFVEAKAAGKEPPRSAFADKGAFHNQPAPSKAELSRPKVRPIFPEPPAAPTVSKPAETKQVEPPKPAPVAKQSIIPEQPVRPAVPEPQAFRPERLESLLNSIKQDLNQLVQK